jgi:hypothetical protein
MITGIDIVQEQIRVAAGPRLTIRQRDVVRRGHAIECRINAEDPDTFAPSPGRITSYHAPGGPGIRVDSHVYHNYFVPPNYDSMIGKVIAYGDTREQAIARMRVALSKMVVEGIKTISLHQEPLLDDSFLRGGTTIHYLEQRMAKRKQTASPSSPMPFVALRFDAPAATAEAWSDAMSPLARHRSMPPMRTPAPATTPRYGEPGDTGGLWALCRLTALFAADADVEASVRRAAEALGLARRHSRWKLSEQDWVRRTQAQFGPLQIADRLWSYPRGAAGRFAGDQSRARPRPGVRHRQHRRRGLPALARRASRAGTVGARLRLRLGHSRHRSPRSSARRRLPDRRDPQAIEASRANAARNGVGAQFMLPDALAPDRSTSSSPISWRTRCGCSRRCSRRASGPGARSCFPAYSKTRSPS